MALILLLLRVWRKSLSSPRGNHAVLRSKRWRNVQRKEETVLWVNLFWR
jgi:hypothetical protein